tara:strand:+ start:1956 stop:3317 length:1362 start_codon:yes stop_codon:yes gene_type:complete
VQLPGYRKRIKSNSGKVKDGGGYTNMNQVVSKIKEMTQNNDEFYEIEPAKVIRVFTDPTEPNFPKLKGSSASPDLTYLGAVIVQLTVSQKSGGSIGISKPIKPISQHIVQYPLKGEIVNVAKYINSKNESALYYSNPLNLNGRVVMNRLVGEPGEGLVFPQNVKLNRKISVKQGDTVMQGRFGQSIHFSSDKKYTNPSIKITVGQSEVASEQLNLKKSSPLVSHKTNINNDGASIYITTNEHIPLKTDAASEMKTPYLGVAPDGEDANGKEKTRKKPTITMNADSIVFNTKNNGDINAYSSRHISLAARTSINLESEFGEINLGSVQSINPVVKGNELKTYLFDILKLFKLYNKNLKAHLSSNKADAIVEAVNLFAKPFEIALEDLVERLKIEGGDVEFLSKKVFVADDKDTPEGELPSLESMFSDVKWEEMAEVTTKEYQVETQTGTAGVRG